MLDHAPTETEDLTEAEIVDDRGRPYFLWDTDMTIDDFRRGLEDADPEVRGYLVAKLLRQARPEHVARFITDDEVRSLWPWAVRYLGRARTEWQARLGLMDQPRTFG